MVVIWIIDLPITILINTGSLRISKSNNRKVVEKQFEMKDLLCISSSSLKLPDFAISKNIDSQLM